MDRLTTIRKASIKARLANVSDDYANTPSLEEDMEDIGVAIFDTLPVASCCEDESCAA